MRRISRFLLGMMLAIGATLGSAAVARDDSPKAWQRLRDVRFEPIASDAKIATLDVPRAIAQDGLGYIWIATDGGLVRWDGHGFRVFSAHRGVAGGLPENLLGAVHADTRGRLWIGLVSDGLRLYDPVGERFAAPRNATPLDHGSVFAIADDGTGGVWAASQRGLAHVDGTTRVATLVPESDGLPSGAVRAVAREPGGSLWAVVGDRLYRRYVTESRFQPFALPSRMPASVPSGASLFVDRAGRLWMTTAAGDLFVVDHGIARRVAVDPPDASASPWLGRIVEAKPGEMWIASDDGILTVDARTLRTRRLRHDARVRKSLPEAQVTDLFRDRAGQVWVAGGQTISRTDPSPHGVAMLADMLGTNRRGEALDPRAIGIDANDRLWIGTKSDGGFVIDPRSGRRAPLIVSPTIATGAAASLRIRAFAGVGKTMYIGTDTGLFVAGLDGRIVRHVSTAPVDRLLADGRRLLMAEGDAIGSLDLDDPAATPVPAIAAARLNGGSIRALALAPDGALWVGTVHGLHRFDRVTGRVDSFDDQMPGGRALSANFVATLLFDHRGDLWAGTGGGGIDILRRGPAGWRVIRHLDKANGLPNDTVDALLQGGHGAIWASTDGGIARIDPDTLATRVLTSADDLTSVEFWTGIAAIAHDGELLFGGVGAIAAIDPAQAARADAHTPLVITAIKVDGVAAPIGDPLVLSSSVGTISVDFAALDFGAADRIAYAYRLKGQTDRWFRVDSDHRTAGFTNLAPGRYTLQIRSSDRYGRWPARLRELPITIEPRWFETWWFKAMLAIAAIAAVVLAARLWTLGLRRAKAALERLVAMRTEELRVSKGALERLVYFDPLTGLGNRRMFVENINRMIADGTRSGFSLILVDLDRFKTVNDRLGHDAGDALLSETAARLLRAVRETDSVTRLGGDEFAILTPGLTDPDAIAALCERIVALFAKDFPFAGHLLRTTPSLGIATYPDHAGELNALYKAADVALYAAKHAGRATWRFAEGAPASACVLPSA